MLSKGSVHATDIWKRFRVDRQRMLLRDELERLRARMRGKADRSWRWVLRDINLVAEPGESVALFGANGSGKSTLLKILTRVMYPNAGRIDVMGRVGALIEIGAGIHPDLSGRENILLNGALVGFSRKEIIGRFDEIVSFAGLEDAIDRQVKFYSSGMKMRLGFSIAAFSDPDVLLVDEVLAVGDATFQQRCLQKMRSVLAGGTTLIFVSHDLATVEATCVRGIWLRDGVVEAEGPVREALAAYRRAIEENAQSNRQLGSLLRLLKAEVTGPRDGVPATQEELTVRLVVESVEERSGSIYIGVTQGPATPIFSVRRDVHLQSGETEIVCTIDRLPLPRGRFYVWSGIVDVNGNDLLSWHPAAHFEVTGLDLDAAPKAVVRLSPVHVTSTWEVGGR